MDAEEYDNLPKHIKRILDTFDEDKDPFRECERIKNLLELIGWTCDYDLSGCISDVQKINLVN